ncbi:restriction endonuclease [Microbacterium oryzae]|nr:restriction endonuclease [Microbacterium oryzae]
MLDFARGLGASETHLRMSEAAAKVKYSARLLEYMKSISGPRWWPFQSRPTLADVPEDALREAISAYRIARMASEERAWPAIPAAATRAPSTPAREEISRGELIRRLNAEISKSRSTLLSRHKGLLAATVEKRINRERQRLDAVWSELQPNRATQAEIAFRTRVGSLMQEARALADELAAVEERKQAQQATHRANIAPPAPQPYGVSHVGAEVLVADWMRYLGVNDATVTPPTADGGVDVDSAKFIAQVKNYVGSVPVEELRALQGVAAVEGKQALLFTSGSITAAGISFARRAKIALIRYDAVRGELRGLNELGTKAVNVGIVAAFNRADGGQVTT